jgi:hypothetical protein
MRSGLLAHLNAGVMTYEHNTPLREVPYRMGSDAERRNGCHRAAEVSDET